MYVNTIKNKDLNLTKAFFSCKISENIDEINAALDGWFLWELAKCGFDIAREMDRINNYDGHFGKILINLGKIANLKNANIDNFQNKIDSIDFKSENKELSLKYSSMLLFLGDSFMLNKDQKEERLQKLLNQ